MEFLTLGPIIVGVHKRNVSPQNHIQDIILKDHYIYRIIYLFFIKYSHSFLLKWLWLIMIWMILKCLEMISWTHVPLHRTMQKESKGTYIFF